MASANYPVTMVRDAMAATSRAYGLDVQLLALPNYVQVGSPTGDNLYIANPAFDVRYDQSFPLAKLVARAPTGSITPEQGMAELDRIRHQRRRFPVGHRLRIRGAKRPACIDSPANAVESRRRSNSGPARRGAVRAEPKERGHRHPDRRAGGGD